NTILGQVWIRRAGMTATEIGQNPRDDVERDTTDPGIIPGGIRDRAWRAVQTKARPASRGHGTRASKKYWAALKRQRETERASSPRMDISSADGAEGTRQTYGRRPVEVGHVVPELKASS